MSKVKVRFKDPDAIFYIVEGRHPTPEDEDDITPKMEKKRDEFCDEYFEYGDYGMFEVDTETLAVRLLPRREWKKK